MMKFGKSNSKVISLVISIVFLCNSVLYAWPVSKDALRPPVGIALARMKHFWILEKHKKRLENIIRRYKSDSENPLEEIEITFANRDDAEEIKAIREANNVAWKGNETLQVTEGIVSQRLARDPNCCIIVKVKYAKEEDEIIVVLWTSRIQTKRKLTRLNPKTLWFRITEGKQEEKPDTIICYAVGIVPGARGEKGVVGTVAIEWALAEWGLKVESTLSPMPKFEKFENEYGEMLKEKGIPEELWPYAYLVSLQGKGPWSYLEYIKENGYIFIRDYIEMLKKQDSKKGRLYCQVQGWHMFANGVDPGVVFLEARPDYKWSVMYIRKGRSIAIRLQFWWKIRELLFYYSGEKPSLSRALLEEIAPRRKKEISKNL